MNQHARLDERPIPFIDVAAQRRRLGRAIDDAVSRVLAHCQFIQGPEVRALETELAAFCGARHAIVCSSGTDALRLVLMAWGIGPGDAVICPTFTFCATAEVVALCGATPVMADVEAATFNLDPASCERAVTTARRLGLKPRADYSGRSVRPAGGSRRDWRDRRQVRSAGARRCGASRSAPPIAAANSARSDRRQRQAFSRPSRSAATAMAAPFSPTTTIWRCGCKSLRVHGEGTDKYDAVRIGITGRLDTIQAAILLEKLKIFPDEIVARNAVAQRYTAGLAEVATVPRVGNEATSVWAQYTIRLAPGRRDALAATLKAQGIPTAIYYAKPLHRQAAYRDFPVADGGLPVSDQLADEVISLPMHAYLEAPVQDRIIAAVRRALAG